MKNNFNMFFLFVFMLVFCHTIYSQDKKEEKKEALSFKPIKFNITEDGSQWFRIILWNQLQLNTTDLDSKVNFNISPNIRRSRLLLLGQVTPKIFTYLHLGVNNVNNGRLGRIDGSDQTQIFLHDAAVEYKFSNKLAVGGGLHYWRGLARLSSWAGLSSLTLDIPNPLVFDGTIGATDQFARHVGIYAKGKLGKIDYRLALNSPSTTGIKEKVSAVSTENHVYGAWNYHDTGKTIIEGNVKYNFIGSESNLMPYVIGTYLGKKETLSASAGFITHPNSVLILKDDTNPITTDAKGKITDDKKTIASKTKTSIANHFSVDVNYDTPLGENGGVLTAYAAYLNYNFGENGGSTAGATGNAFYTQIGYLIPKTKLQPYAVYQNRNWKGSTILGTQRAGNSYTLGTNYYLSGHNLKLTLEYVKNDFFTGPSNSQARFQLHISI